MFTEGVPSRDEVKERESDPCLINVWDLEEKLHLGTKLQCTEGKELRGKAKKAEGKVSNQTMPS